MFLKNKHSLDNSSPNPEENITYNNDFSIEAVEKAILESGMFANTPDENLPQQPNQDNYIDLNTSAKNEVQNTFDNLNLNYFDKKINQLNSDIDKVKLNDDFSGDETTESVKLFPKEKQANDTSETTQIKTDNAQNIDTDTGTGTGTSSTDFTGSGSISEKRNNNKKSIPFDFIDGTSSYAGMPFDRVERDVKIKDRLYVIRSVIMFILTALSIYITMSAVHSSLYMPFGLQYIQKPFLYLLLLIIIQGICAFLSLDIVASGLFRLVQLRPTTDSIVFLSCVASFAHCLSIILHPQNGGYLPYTSISCLMLFFSTVSRSHKYSSLRKTTRILSSSNIFTGIIFEKSSDGDINAIKADVEKNIDLSDLKELSATDKYSCVFAPISIISAFVLAGISSFGTGNPQLFLWAVSAMLAVAAPVSLIISSSLPIKRTAGKLYSMGSALIGLSGTKKVNSCKGAVLFDEDIFPNGSVEINGVKMSGASPEENMAYTSSTIEAADLGTKRIFADLSRQHQIKASDVRKLRFYESGGITAEINGRNIAIGNSGFLIRLGIHITEGLNLKTAVFSSVNMCFSGLFALKYNPLSFVKNSLNNLIKAKIPPIIATRDFNITPGMIERSFKLKRGIIEYPDIAERLEYSSKERLYEETPAAVSLKSGISSFTSCLCAMKKLGKICRKNIIYSTLSAIIGQSVIFFLTYKSAFSAAVPSNILIYQALWALIIYAVSARISRY